MDFIEEYIAYLKDNPEGYWFKRKLYGWGWVPARPQGWAVMGVYLAFVFVIFFFIVPRADETSILSDVLLPIIVATILLLIITWKKGESPKWQWGKYRD